MSIGDPGKSHKGGVGLYLKKVMIRSSAKYQRIRIREKLQELVKQVQLLKAYLSSDFEKLC